MNEPKFSKMCTSQQLVLYHVESEPICTFTTQSIHTCFTSLGGKKVRLVKADLACWHHPQRQLVSEEALVGACNRCSIEVALHKDRQGAAPPFHAQGQLNLSWRASISFIRTDQSC